MLELIQLFKNDDFHKKLRLACSKMDYQLIANQTAAALYFSGGNTIRRDKIFLVDNEVIEKYHDQLYQLSTSNFIVFIYENENIIVKNDTLERIADQYLPLNFSQAQFYATISLSKKSLKGHIDTVFPKINQYIGKRNRKFAK